MEKEIKTTVIDINGSVYVRIPPAICELYNVLPGEAKISLRNDSVDVKFPI